jgi:CBS domain-containing protein
MVLQPRKVAARDIMTADVVTLREDATISEAVAVLEDYHVTGAPVVNALGECVGVFSLSDLVKRGEEIEAGEAPRSGGYFTGNPIEEDEEYFSREDYDEAVLGRDTVGQWMTPSVQAVAPDATLEDVSKRMLAERIHRVLVMDGLKVAGIVSSFDIVRFVAGQDAGEARKPGGAGKAHKAGGKRQRGGAS